MRRARVLACCLAMASALPASVAGQPTAGFDALTPAAGTLPAGCALVPVAVERAQGGHVTGGLWAWQRLRSNPWTGQAPQILAEIRMRMFGPLALPDAPPDARTDAQIARTLVEGVSGYAAVYRQDGARVAVYALRSADRRRWTRSPVPERDDGTGQAFSRIGKGNVAALVVGDRGPCFAALERHLQSAVPATDAARTSRPASLLLDAAWLREGRARAEKGETASRTPGRRSIRRAVDFIAPYVAGERRWAFDQITPFSPAAMHRTLRRGAAAWHDPQLTRLAERSGGGDSRLILTIP